MPEEEDESEQLRDDGEHSESFQDDQDIDDQSVAEQNNTNCFNNDNDERKYNIFNFALTNARSLQTKVGSLIDVMNELDLHMSVVTETWFKNTKQVGQELEEIEDAEDIAVICRNRSGRRGGGVSVAYNKRKMALKNYPLRNNKYELLCAAGKSVDDTRKYAIFAVYIPPSQKASKTKEMMV